MAHRTSARFAFAALAALLVGGLATPVRAQNAVACDFDISDTRGLNVSGSTVRLTGRAGASSTRGQFVISNGNTPSGDEDGDGYAPACNFNDLFLAGRLNLINVANPSLAIPASAIVLSNLNAVLLSGESQLVDVQVQIPAGTSAGRYIGHVTIRDNKIFAVPNLERQILNLDGIDIEVIVLPEAGMSILNADSPVRLDSLLLSARSGQRAQGVFRVANAGNTPLTDLRLSASDLRSESAVDLVIPAKNITFNAPSFSALQLGDTARVTVGVDVPRGLLGGRYRGTITVQGQGIASQTLPLIVTVTSNRGILFRDNPVRTVNGDIGRIAFNGDPGTTWKLAIYDMTGLLVYTTTGTVFNGAATPAGGVGLGADFAVSVSWPLVNGRGEDVASGMYLVVVESFVNGQRQLAKDRLMVIR
ncbi:MAG: hypothetical protein JWO05_3958 [Gemmatimonadetes bacterium]|nr:hypothetical protein [Gemmatimonadota bacterium]